LVDEENIPPLQIKHNTALISITVIAPANYRAGRFEVGVGRHRVLRVEL